MKYTYEVIESHDDIVRLLKRDGVPSVIFYEVYNETPNIELEETLGELESDEVFYRVDLSKLSQQAYRFARIS